MNSLILVQRPTKPIESAHFVSLLCQLRKAFLHNYLSNTLNDGKEHVKVEVSSSCECSLL